MQTKINNITIEYPLEFSRNNPEIMEILSDANHITIFIDNGEYEDMIVFISHKFKKFKTIYMSEFEEHLKKHNKRIFFNVSVLFTEYVDGLISSVSLVSKSDYSDILSKNIEIKEINFTKKGKTLYIYFGTESEIGEIIDIESILMKKRILKTLQKYNIDETEDIFYSRFTDTLWFVNRKTGYCAKFPISMYPDAKIIKHTANNVLLPFDEIVICDIRQSFKYFTNNDCKELNYVVKDKVLYITFISDSYKFSTLEEYSMYVYNNNDNSCYLDLKSDNDEIFYVINGTKFDFIITIKNNVSEIHFIKDLNIDKDCCEIQESFPIENIISLHSFNTKSILNVEMNNEEEIDGPFLTTNNFIFWYEEKEKQLFIKRVDSQL